jgi:Lon protease-like protein
LEHARVEARLPRHHRSHVRDLLALKRRLRLPDARFGDDQPPTRHALELDTRVRAITDQALKALGEWARAGTRGT